MQHEFLLRVCAVPTCCVFVDGCFVYSSFVCMFAFAYISKSKGPLRECRSIRLGAYGLPEYCAPLVCVPDVIRLLAVWRHNKPKPKPDASTSLAHWECFVEFWNRLIRPPLWESCKIFKGRPRRNAFSKLAHRQYKSFPPDRFTHRFLSDGNQKHKWAE